MDLVVGMIYLFAFNFAPQGLFLCDGKEYPVAQYQALYALIGNRYGGNSNQFAVPNLLQASPITNMNYYIAAEGIFPQPQ